MSRREPRFRSKDYIALIHTVYFTVDIFSRQEISKHEKIVEFMVKYYHRNKNVNMEMELELCNNTVWAASHHIT